MRNRLLLAMLLTLSFISCTKIENLSVDNSLKSLMVLNHSPKSISLGDVILSRDTVYIPVEYGKYEFPLTLEVEVKVAAGAYVYGLDRGDKVVFNTIDDDPLRFVVSAASGVSKNYFLALKEIPLGESCEIFDTVLFSDVADGLLLGGELLPIAGELSCKQIVALDVEYPLMVTPHFSVADGSVIESYREKGSDSWSDFANGECPVTFVDAEHRYQFKVVSQSGRSDVCEIGSVVVNYSAIDPTMQINYRDLSAVLEHYGVVVHGFDVDFKSGEITILLEEVDDSVIEFPISVSMDIPVNDWLSCVGVSKNQRYTFDGWNAEFPFALLYADKLQATSWSIKIARYQKQLDPTTVSSVDVNNFSCGTYSTFLFTYNHLTRSEKRSQAEVYEHTREILLYYSSFYEPFLSSSSIDSWWAEYDLNLTLSNGESITQLVRWEAEPNSSDNITKTEIRAAVSSIKYIEIDQADGTVGQWSVKLVKDNVLISSDCELLNLVVVSTLPHYIDFKDPLYTVNDGSSDIYLNIGDHYDFPMSIDLEYEISPYASVESNILHFEDELSEQKFKIMAQDGVTYKEYTVRLIVPQESTAPVINNVIFGDLAAGATFVGDVTLDAEDHVIRFGVEASGADFPLDVPIVGVEVADGGSFDMPSSGAVNFVTSKSKPMVWVSSADGSARQMWSFEIYYYQQLAGGDMDSWEWDANPVTSSAPWATPNMSGIASVKNTTPVAGRSGVVGDYAAEMVTGTSWGQLASGSIFTGWFDKNNSTAYGLTDPVRLTHFGIPIMADAKIKGVAADVSYAQAKDAVDWGSLTVILIDDKGVSNFEFHGNKPKDYSDPTAGSSPHPNNTAVEVSLNKMIFGNGTASKTSYGDDISMNVNAGEWVEVFIPISTDKPFTHISVAAASSAYGDYFIGKVGSVMKIDNVRIIYE